MDKLDGISLKIRHFCKERDWDQFHNPKDLAIGVITEASELLELFRFLDSNQVKEALQNSQKREAIGEELADVMFFLLRFADLYDFDLPEVVLDKLIKNAQKYPVEKFKGLNQKYNETK